MCVICISHLPPCENLIHILTMHYFGSIKSEGLWAVLYIEISFMYLYMWLWYENYRCNKCDEAWNKFYLFIYLIYFFYSILFIYFFLKLQISIIFYCIYYVGFKFWLYFKLFPGNLIIAQYVTPVFWFDGIKMKLQIWCKCDIWLIMTDRSIKVIRCSFFLGGGIACLLGLFWNWRVW